MMPSSETLPAAAIRPVIDVPLAVNSPSENTANRSAAPSASQAAARAVGGETAALGDCAFTAAASATVAQPETASRRHSTQASYTLAAVVKRRLIGQSAGCSETTTPLVAARLGQCDSVIVQRQAYRSGRPPADADLASVRIDDPLAISRLPSKQH
jgi:hypothetical protein